MASVAIPLIASFFVGKIGESQGWDPRFTAILSMAAGGFAGMAYGASAAAGTAATASRAGSVAGSLATSVNPHLGMGVKAVASGTMGAPAVAGSAWGYAPTPGPAMSPLTSAPSYFGQPGMQQGLSAPPTGDGDLTGRFKPNQFVNQDGTPVGGTQFHQKDNMGNVVQNTFQSGMKDQWDAWTTRGEDGKLSAAENFGMFALKTLMKELPKTMQTQSLISSASSQGGPMMPPFSSGGGSGQGPQVTWGFGNHEGYVPQGV